jgi:hypothetical protein
MDLRDIENRYMLYMYCVHLSSCVDSVACGFVLKQNQTRLCVVIFLYKGYCNFTVIFTLLLFSSVACVWLPTFFPTTKMW